MCKKSLGKTEDALVTLMVRVTCFNLLLTHACVCVNEMQAAMNFYKAAHSKGDHSLVVCVCTLWNRSVTHIRLCLCCSVTGQSRRSCGQHAPGTCTHFPILLPSFTCSFSFLCHSPSFAELMRACSGDCSWQDLGRYDEAEVHYRDCVRIFRVTCGEGSPLTCQVSAVLC